MFICVHKSKSKDSELLINVDHIQSVSTTAYGRTVVSVGEQDDYVVEESYEQIKKVLAPFIEH